MIVVIPPSGDGCKPGGADSEWLPRRCPGCGQETVIGHGRRERQAHDRLHDSIRVRRGICKQCRRTLTVLPDGCIPGTQYNLPARQEAIAGLALGRSVEQAAPECRDADRVADPRTIRRWAQRRWESVCVWVQWAWCWWRGPPTLLAWDWRAAARMLIPEPNSA